MGSTKFRNVAGIAAGLALAALAVRAIGDIRVAIWPFSGNGLSDTRSQDSESIISRSNVSSLTPEWTYGSFGSVSVTPVVASDGVYFPDWAGRIYDVDPQTGRLIWSKPVFEYDGYPGAVVRVAPAIYGNELIFGDNQGYTAQHNGANVIAVDRHTGALEWITQVDSHPAAAITGPAAVANGVLYQGISSTEEFLAENAAYPCCSYRGSVVALDAATGAILWQTYDMPNNGGRPGGYSGGAIWQQPAIDTARGLLYIGTGNNYSVPAAVEECQNTDILYGHPQEANCEAPDDYFDTALALDLGTGAIRWSKRLQGYDAWNLACGATLNPHCPSPKGPDYDLGGSGPNLLPNMVGFGQKSGIYWALDPDTGNVLWATPVGPGGSLGGIEWGSATDGTNIYAAIGNNSHLSYTLINGQTINWGSWSALDAATGSILWQTADPVMGSLDTGSLTAANGVLYAGSLDAAGHMYALNTDTGQILWRFASGGSVIDGPSVVNGILYWGSGYPRAGGKANNVVYAFTVPK